tara:strand:+ start:654 stop:998 length:345 start_codon:yes stop_codon:yes gene_type:complete
METLITVLITLLVVAIIGAGINLVRLNRKADELDTLKLEVIDVEDRMEKQLEDLSKDHQDQFKDVWMRTDELSKDYKDRIEKWVASTDRRFDKAYNDIRELDQVVNPNKDLLKK